MELRQRGQRPSEPSDQNASPSWNQHQRQTSENNIAYNNAAVPPPPPPRRSPSVPAVTSSPMFHNPQMYNSMRSSTSSINSSASMNNMATPYGQRYPRTGSVSSYGAATAPPAATAYSRSHTEPYHQVEAVANAASAAASPHVRNYSYTGQSMGSVAGYQNNPAYDNNRSYSGYSNISSIDMRNNVTPPTSSNLTSNPYKSHSKSSKLGRLFASLLYISIALLGTSSIYLRRAITSVNAQISQAHHITHRRHLNHVKKTGGRHGHAARNAAQKQTAEITRLENLQISLQRQIDEKAVEYQKLMSQYQAEEGKLEGLESTKQNHLKLIEHEQALLDNLEMEKEEHTAVLVSKEKLDEVVKKRENALWSRVEKLSKQIGAESAREAIDWFGEVYGPGPYKIEIELSYPHVPPEDHPNPHSWQRVSRWIVIETAPLDLMPHAINTFLRQVHHKLLEGMVLTINNQEKLQFTPNNDQEVNNMGHQFSHLLYQEYNPKFPHNQWTVGYANRPAGPDFFINLQDNNYGPQGDAHAEADPCFGKIIEGYEILERIGMIPHYGGGDEEGLKGLYEVKILSAFLIKPRNDVNAGEHVHGDPEH